MIAEWRIRPSSGSAVPQHLGSGDHLAQLGVDVVEVEVPRLGAQEGRQRPERAERDLRPEGSDDVALQLVGLVDHHVVDRPEEPDLAARVGVQLGVGGHQGVVDDDDLGGRRDSLGVLRPARRGEERAVLAQTVVRRDRDLAPGVVVDLEGQRLTRRDLEVGVAVGLVVGGDRLVDLGGVGVADVLQELGVAHVVAAALEHGVAEVDPEVLAQEREILVHDLALERLGAR